MMQWLNELVWIGNTLLPRWFVFGLPTAAMLGVLMIIFIAIWRS